MDDFKGMLAAALRMLSTQDPAAAKAAGAQGAAGRLDANARDAYLQYVEQATVSGEPVLPYAQWYLQRNPAASPVRPFGG